jgi:hypothetical protein
VAERWHKKMGRIEIYECEQCKKRTEKHYYDEKGWIIISESGNDMNLRITTSLGRNEEGTALTIYKKIDNIALLSFCCFNCLIAWFGKMREE